MAYDPTALSHQEWIGYVQPVGVVVSTPALLEAGAAINRNSVPLHREFLAVLPQDGEGNAVPNSPTYHASQLKFLSGGQTTSQCRMNR
jgi:hypothetical protein